MLDGSPRILPSSCLNAAYLKNWGLHTRKSLCPSRRWGKTVMADLEQPSTAWKEYTEETKSSESWMDDWYHFQSHPNTPCRQTVQLVKFSHVLNFSHNLLPTRFTWQRMPCRSCRHRGDYERRNKDKAKQKIWLKLLWSLPRLLWTTP